MSWKFPHDCFVSLFIMLKSRDWNKNFVVEHNNSRCKKNDFSPYNHSFYFIFFVHITWDTFSLLCYCCSLAFLMNNAKMYHFRLLVKICLSFHVVFSLLKIVFDLMSLLSGPWHLIICTAMIIKCIRNLMLIFQSVLDQFLVSHHGRSRVF